MLQSPVTKDVTAEGQQGVCVTWLFGLVSIACSQRPGAATLAETELGEAAKLIKTRYSNCLGIHLFRPSLPL